MAEGQDRGSGSVLMLTVIALAGFLITVSLLLATAIIARHEAGAIADLSALAAAGEASGPQACARAGRVAAANAGRLVQCRILGDGSVRVEVELVSRAGFGPARGAARAGQQSSR